MTPDVPAIRALAVAATPGPWKVKDTYSSDGGRRWEWVGVASKHAYDHIASVDGPDAAYIAALSPDVALALCDRVAALEAALEQGIEAMRLTREYVGEDMLPAIEGWSWCDWVTTARAALGGRP